MADKPKKGDPLVSMCEIEKKFGNSVPEGARLVHIYNALEKVLVDESDYDRVSKKSWRVYKTNGGRYKNIQHRDNNVTIYLHRFVLEASPNQFIDHKNRDTLDNRRSNLRFCSPFQNQGNRARNFNNSSQFKGVSIYRDGRWRARINKGYKGLHIGYYKSEKDAALAYDRKARKYFGEFAKTNFP